MAASGKKGSVRGSLSHESFPCVVGPDAARLAGDLDTVIRTLPAAVHGQDGWAPAAKSGGWLGGKPSPFTPRIEVLKQPVSATSRPLVRVTAALPARQLTLADAQGALAFLHIHTHAPQIVAALFPGRVDQAKVLALLPLRGGGAGDGQPTTAAATAAAANGGAGPDSSVLKLHWKDARRKKRSSPCQFVLAQRTGRYRALPDEAGTGGDFVYHVMAGVKNPDHVPILGIGSPYRSGADEEAMGGQEPLLALVVGHSREQGCLDVSLLLSPGAFFGDAAAEAAALRAANVALGRYVAETVGAHRAMGLALPDLTLAVISPYANLHRILLRMPEASGNGGGSTNNRHPSRLSSASASSMGNGNGNGPSVSYRVVSVRFICASNGLFTVGGLAPKDQALFPSFVMEKILYHPFKAGELTEVRFVCSSTETREATLVWSGLARGALHRYTVDVRLVHRTSLARTLAYLEASFHHARAGATQQARRLAAAKKRREEANPACPGTFSLADTPTSVSIVRQPAQLREAALPLALSLPVPLNATAKPIVARRLRSSSLARGGQQALSYASSLSAALLPHLIQRPTRLVAALDALWPLVLAGGFNAFIFYALKRYPELVAALDRMSLTGVAVGLGLVHLSLGITFHALVTNKVKTYLRLAHLEFAVLDTLWWWRLAVYVHAWGTVVVTLVLGLAARVMTLRRGFAGSKWIMSYLDALQLERVAEEKLLLLGGMGAVSLLLSLAVAFLHVLCGSNRELNVALVVLLDRLGILRPIEAPPANNLHPFGRNLAARLQHAASSAGRDPLAASTTSSLDSSGGHGHAKKASPAPVVAPAPTPSPSTASRLRKGLGSALSSPAAGSPGAAANSTSRKTPKSGGGGVAEMSSPPAQPQQQPTPSPYKTSLAAGLFSSPSAAAAAGGGGGGAGISTIPSTSTRPAEAAAAAALPDEAEGERIMETILSRGSAAESPQQGQGHAEAAAAGAGAGAAAGAFGRVVNPDYEGVTARKSVDRAMHKSGLVKEERYTGGVVRHRVWKDVYLVVDGAAATVYKRKDDASVVHHRFPILELGTRRILAPDFAGFALFGPGAGGQGVEFRCEGGEGEVDKWLSVLNWNQLVAGRRRAEEGKR